MNADNRQAPRLGTCCCDLRRDNTRASVDRREDHLEPARKRLVVLSPHLDDAALSLGATIACTSQGGIPVTVLTVFAGDPHSDEPPGMWDKLCGFVSAGDAARSRRVEDARACDVMGAEPVWLPFPYAENVHVRDEDEIWDAIEPHLRQAVLTLIPGHPLAHPEHAWLTRLVAERASASTSLGLYVEQPYANLVAIGRGYAAGPALAAAAIALRVSRGRALQRPAPEAFATALIGQPVEWFAARAEGHHRSVKIESIKEYVSQVQWLGRRLLPRIRLYEWGWGGEGIGLPVVAELRGHRHRVVKWDARALLRNSYS